MASATADAPLDEFDNIVDPFDGEEGIDWAHILDATQAAVLPRLSSPDYFSDEEPLNDAFLAELDIIDGTAAPSATFTHVPSSSSDIAQHPTTSTTPSLQQTLPSPHNASPGTTLKRRRCGSESTPSSETGSPASSSSGSRSPRKKKRKSARLVLSAFEDDLTCSICCDIFVAAHLLTPCGHTYCGECIWQWTEKNRKTTCPECRTRLTHTSMVPNIAVDKAVACYIQMLGLHGGSAWRAGGQKLTDFNRRKKKWKDEAAERNKLATNSLVVKWIEVSDDEDDEDEEDEDYVEALTEMELEHMRAYQQFRVQLQAAV